MEEPLIQMNKTLFDTLVAAGVKNELSSQKAAIVSIAKMVGAYNRELKFQRIDYWTRKALVAQLQNRLLNQG